MKKTITVGLSLLLISTIALAQGSSRKVPKQIVVDANGLWQWKSLQKEHRKKYKGFDLFVSQPCPQCNTTTTNVCVTCGGAKVMRLEGGNPKGNKCSCCNGKGKVKCSLCKGKGKVEACKFGSVDIRKATVVQLKAAKSGFDKVLKDLMNAGRGPTPQKQGAHYAKVIKPAGKWLKGAKRQGAGLNKRFKAIAKLQQFRGHSFWVQQIFLVHKVGLQRHIENNVALIDLALQRLKHNKARQEELDAKEKSSKGD